MTAERWAPIPGWAAYEVSDHGRVRSIGRVLSDGRTAGGVELAQQPDRDGYLWVTLRQADVRWRVGVHLLVKLAFTGPRRGREVRHLNDIPTDNRLSNLRYGTRRQNRADRKRNQERKAGHERKYGTGEKAETDVIRKGFSSLDSYDSPRGAGERL